MNKADKDYLRECQSWLHTHDFTVKSCQLAIKQHEETIDLLKKKIALEKRELVAKLKTRKSVLAQIAQVKKRNK